MCAGTGNGMAKSLLHAAGETCSVSNAVLAIIKGHLSIPFVIMHKSRVMRISCGESYRTQTSRYTQVTSSPWMFVLFCKGRRNFSVSC